MKKIISILVLVVTMVTMLTACGKFECDMCGEEKSGKKHKDELLGEEIVICNDCYKGLKELADAFE